MTSLNDYKVMIKNMFLQNRDLQKLIYYNSINPLNEVNIRNPYILFENANNPNPTEKPRIYFKFKNPDTLTEVQTFILIRLLEYPIARSLAFNNINIIFTIIMDNTLVELGDGSDRMIKIKEEIDKFMVGNSKLGFKKVKSNGIRDIQVNNNCSGINLIYKTTNRSFNYNNTNGSV